VAAGIASNPRDRRPEQSRRIRLLKGNSIIRMQKSTPDRHPELLSGSFMQTSHHIFFWKAIAVATIKR